MRSKIMRARAFRLLITVLTLTLSLLAQQKSRVPTQQELAQLDSALDAAPDIGHLFRANPVLIVHPSVVTKTPSLQALFKQNPALLTAIVEYKNAFQQREFRFAYGEAGNADVPRAAVDWFDAYLATSTSVATALRKSPAAIDDASVVSDPPLQAFLRTYPTFTDHFKKHPGVFVYSPDFFKHYR